MGIGVCVSFRLQAGHLKFNGIGELETSKVNGLSCAWHSFAWILLYIPTPAMNACV